MSTPASSPPSAGAALPASRPRTRFPEGSQARRLPEAPPRNNPPGARRRGRAWLPREETTLGNTAVLERPASAPAPLNGRELHPDGRVTAKAAHLRYVSDQLPGIRRRRAGRGFTYAGPDGQTVRDPEVLRRI